MVEAGRDSIHVAVCCVTGAEGREIVERFQKVNAMRQEVGEPLMHVRGFTRDQNSPEAKDLQDQYPNHLTMVEVDYASSRSLRKSMTGMYDFSVNLCENNNGFVVDHPIRNPRLPSF